MKKISQKLYLQFLKKLSEQEASEVLLREAIADIAPEYHLMGLEVTVKEALHLGSGGRTLTLYENLGGEAASDELEFVFDEDTDKEMRFSFYPYEKTFSIEEREELYIYATYCNLYLLKLAGKGLNKENGNIQYLTGLPNAGGYIGKIVWLMSEGVPLSYYSACYFNLRGFGVINRRIGYANADRLMKAYADVIRGFFEEDEVLGHLGGDNFVALVRQNRQDALISFLSDVVVESSEGEAFHISATIGIWEIEEDHFDPGEIISRPAIALNQAKNVLHQDVAFASDRMVDRISQQKSILGTYNEALEREEFHVFYQPKVDSRTGTLVGAEGLVRWFRDGQMISPGLFIPPLEENGQILHLDYYVLKHACADIKRWLDEGLEPVPISVNFSRKDLEDKQLAKKINDIIEASGIEKSLIEIEVTETVDTHEHGELAAFINHLYEKELMTAIDDFGSGYSSLATLREFQVHTLKIDRSFVNTDDFSWKDEVILRDIIHMAQELGIETLTEGVERDDQLAFVNSVGCYVIQGYYYDKPLPVGEFEERLRNKVYAS